jgi:hypothetical protein
VFVSATDTPDAAATGAEATQTQLSNDWPVAKTFSLEDIIRRETTKKERTAAREVLRTKSKSPPDTAFRRADLTFEKMAEIAPLFFISACCARTLKREVCFLL